MSGLSKTFIREISNAFNVEIPALTNVSKIAFKVKPDPIYLHLLSPDPVFPIRGRDDGNFSAQQTLDGFTEISNNIVLNTKETQKGNRPFFFVGFAPAHRGEVRDRASRIRTT